ncbi:MAG TPA: hypothetical protein VJQ85_03300 [Gaiellaceae bacterium]|nr:hypothetical protein [Gaiellaceae bacterium]
MSRLRGASKAPVAVAGILALPLFFVALLAFTLKLDKPSHRLTSKGTLALADPTKGTVGTIYLVALAVSVAVVAIGLLAMFLRSRLALVVPAVAAIVGAVLLLLPLGTWAAEHANRYPLGVDNIPQKSPQDLALRGEWEQGAKAAAHQIALVTIGLAGAAILIGVALEVRRRRGVAGRVVPPSPAVAGSPEVSPALDLELADSDLVQGQRPGRWRWR